MSCSKPPLVVPGMWRLCPSSSRQRQPRSLWPGASWKPLWLSWLTGQTWRRKSWYVCVALKAAAAETWPLTLIWWESYLDFREWLNENFVAWKWRFHWKIMLVFYWLLIKVSVLSFWVLWSWFRLLAINFAADCFEHLCVKWCLQDLSWWWWFLLVNTQSTVKVIWRLNMVHWITGQGLIHCSCQITLFWKRKWKNEDKWTRMSLLTPCLKDDGDNVKHL